MSIQNDIQILKNPITGRVRELIEYNDRELNFSIAVPFISDFARKFFIKEYFKKAGKKRLITRFDPTNINSFDLPTFKYLIDNGVEIVFNNNIHLKLYIINGNSIVTSSNLTNGGFENNFELTVCLPISELTKCQEIFNQLWNDSLNNRIDLQAIENNLEAYNFLKKKNDNANSRKVEEFYTPDLEDIDIDEMISIIADTHIDRTKKEKLVVEVNKNRKKFIKKILNGFDTTSFYAEENHPKRKESLFYEFVYGIEEKLAGTGLRESQFRDVFTNSQFKEVINFILPQLLELNEWNLGDKSERLNFCSGIFEFDIPQYKEVMPIRLASYFYPNYFLPIFKIDHLEMIANFMGYTIQEELSKGEKVFYYNDFLIHRLDVFSYDNFIKSNILYELLYTVTLFRRLEKGESFSEIRKSYTRNWKRSLIDNGRDTLVKMKIIK